MAVRSGKWFEIDGVILLSLGHNEPTVGHDESYSLCVLPYSVIFEM